MLHNEVSTSAIYYEQRRKSAPECFLPFKLNTTANVTQNADSSTSLISKKLTPNHVFTSYNPTDPQYPCTTIYNHSSNHITPSDKTDLSSLLRQFSSMHSGTYTSPPLSSLSSTSSYFLSSSYSNSITLPAPPIFISSFTTLKKKKRHQKQPARNRGMEVFTYRPSGAGESSDTGQSVNTSIVTSQTSSSDIELATEIGQGLLNEVRRMQRLLKERQDSLISLEIEKTENLQRIDDLLKELRNKNESEERLKENIWNLELNKQDLSHQIRHLSLCISKNQMEQSRRDRQENLLHQELEKLKTTQLNREEARFRLQYEHDTTVLELTQSIENLKKERDDMASRIDALIASREADSKNTVSHQDALSEKIVDGLRISLAQAESVVAHLQQDLEAERNRKSELDLLLRESQEIIETIQKSDLTWNTDSNEITSESIITETDKRLTMVTLEDELSSSPDRKHHHSKQYQSDYNSLHTSYVVQSIYTKKHHPHFTESPSESYKTSAEDKMKDEFKQLLPYVMHTMIGEWMFKYTRNKVGNGISEKRCHKRFFWLHPYTKTLYWSQQQPGVEEGEWKVKSVSIESFSVYEHPIKHTQPLIIVQTSTRDLKLKCMSIESHRVWVQSLSCLLNTKGNRGTKKKSIRHHRLSLLLETDPPSTIGKGSSIIQRNHQEGNRRLSVTRFGSLRMKK